MVTAVSADATVSLFWIALAAALAPLIGRAARGALPQAVLLLLAGVLIGPSVLGLAAETDLELVRELGLGLLFLLAGFEVDTDSLRGRQGTWASVTWLLSWLAALGLVVAVGPDIDTTAAIALAIALTSTALGTLLPILQERGLMGSPIGRGVMVHGAIGELLPVLAMAILLGSKAPLVTVLLLVGFALVTVAAAVVPRRFLRRAPQVYHSIVGTSGGTTQTTLRPLMTLLLGLMALAALMDVDVVLGAFAAGVVIRRLAGPDTEDLEGRLNLLAHSFFVPAFFVLSGMSIGLADVVEAPWFVVSTLLLIVLLRGGGIWLTERLVDTGSGLRTPRERAALSLYGATGLPIIVAVTEVAVSSDLMPEEVASGLVAAGALSVLVLPLLAGRLLPGPQEGAGAAPTTEAVR